MKFRLIKSTNSESRDRIASNVAKGTLFIQKKWAAGMNRMVHNASVKTQRIVFFFFLLIMTLYCVWTIYRGFNNTEPAKKENSFVLPKLVHPIENTNNLPNQKQLQESIQAFKHFADSLKKIGGPDWENFKQQYGPIADSIPTLIDK